jgi:hypothetical protein
MKKIILIILVLLETIVVKAQIQAFQFIGEPKKCLQKTINDLPTSLVPFLYVSAKKNLIEKGNSKIMFLGRKECLLNTTSQPVLKVNTTKELLKKSVNDQFTLPKGVIKFNESQKKTFISKIIPKEF